jgi:hypothetical protein
MEGHAAVSGLKRLRQAPLLQSSRWSQSLSGNSPREHEGQTSEKNKPDTHSSFHRFPPY